MANDSESRLKTLALIIKFGHDLFDKKDFKSTAGSAVNDSHLLLQFRSSAVFRLHDDKSSTLLGQFAQPEVNEHSLMVQAQKKLIGDAEFDQQGIAFFKNSQLPDILAENDSVYLLCKLTPPASSHLDGSYIWLLEYEKDIPSSAAVTAQLLGKSIAEALSSAENAESGRRWQFLRFLRKSSRITLFFLLLCGIMFIPVRESATAEFMLKAPEITAVYSKFEGSVQKCLKQDGSFVRKDEVIIRFDTSELQYRLANAKAELKEAEADLEVVQQEAFTDEKKLGKVQLLKARCKVLQVAVQEAEWFLKNSELKAAADGILVLADERAEQLTGKSVRAGDKLFETYGGQGMIAEIMVNERDSSILQHHYEPELFLYTAPEKGIACQIISVSQYPVLNNQKLYCYPIRVKLLDEDSKKLRFGMRGIAKLSGGKVSLGYYLFKNLILYFRNW